MKKAIGIAVAMIMMGVVLAGCYNKSCEAPCAPAPVSLKGEG